MKKTSSQFEIFMTLVFRTILAHINKLFPKIMPLPKIVDNYKLTTRLAYKSNWNNYKIGLYKDKTGKKYFAKQWSGRFKDFEYAMLENEEKALTSLQKIKVNAKTNIKIPHVINSFKTANSYIVLFDYIEKNKTSLKGESLENLYDAINYMKKLGENKSLRKKIQERKSGFVFATYILSLVIILLTNPKLFPLVVRHFPYFIKHIKVFINNKDLILTHRDIHYENILLSKSQLYLIDFALCAFTLEYIEEITMLAHAWNDKLAKKSFEEKFYNLFKENKQNHTLFLLSTIAVVTHLLTEKSQSKIDTKNYKSMLNTTFALATKSTHKVQEAIMVMFALLHAKSGIYNTNKMQETIENIKI